MHHQAVYLQVLDRNKELQQVCLAALLILKEQLAVYSEQSKNLQRQVHLVHQILLDKVHHPGVSSEMLPSLHQADQVHLVCHLELQKPQEEISKKAYLVQLHPLTHLATLDLDKPRLNQIFHRRKK